MRDTAFYGTVAQVIPTLLIALAVEFVGIRSADRAAGKLPDHEEALRMAARDEMPVDWLVVITALVGMLVFIAEGCALLVLLIGPNTWFSLMAAPVCTIAALVLTLLIAYFAWARLVRLSFGLA